MRRMMTTVVGLMSLTTLGLLSGCAAPSPVRVVTETRTVEVPVPVQVALDPSLTAQEPPPTIPRPMTNGDGEAALMACGAALARANGKLAQIEALQPTP